MSNSVSEAKGRLRKEILATRMNLADEENRSKSRAIFEKLMDLDRFRNCSWIMAYIDFRNEVYTRDFINKCMSLNIRIAVPLAVKEANGDKALWACEIIDMDKDLEISNYGILEPKKEYIRRVDPQKLDIVVVPGVAFDIRKFRLGYGAGYYDRFLKTVSENCLNIGVAFDLQVVDRVPAEKHDVPLDVIITEKRII